MNATVVTVLRTTATEQFTILPNDVLRGRLPRPLHVMARCILNHLLSLPPGWKITRAQLDEGFVEGAAAVTTGLKELRTNGYLVQNRRRTAVGTYAWSWHVTDDPVERPLPPTRDTRHDPAAPAEDPIGPEAPAPSPDEPGMVGAGMDSTAASPPSPGKPQMADHPMVDGGIKEEDGLRRLEEPASTLSTQPAASPDGSSELALVPLPAKTPTLNERAQTLTRGYHERVPLCQFVAVLALVKRALKADYDDARVRAALMRLADSGTTVTANTLRIELEQPGRGSPAPPGRRGVRPTATERARRVLALGDEAAGT